MAHVSMFLFPTHWPLGQEPPKAPLSGVSCPNSLAENRSRCKGFELGLKIWRLGAVLKPQSSQEEPGGSQGAARSSQEEPLGVRGLERRPELSVAGVGYSLS